MPKKTVKKRIKTVKKKAKKKTLKGRRKRRDILSKEGVPSKKKPDLDLVVSDLLSETEGKSSSRLSQNTASNNEPSNEKVISKEVKTQKVVVRKRRRRRRPTAELNGIYLKFHSALNAYLRQRKSDEYITTLTAILQRMRGRRFLELSLFTGSIAMAVFLLSILALFFILGSTAQNQNNTSHELIISSTKTTTSTTTTQVKITTTTTTTSTTTSSTTAIICNPPYIRFGLGCCMDTDSNSVCDSDDSTTTTTTTLPFVFCKRDVECGNPKIEYGCKENDVVKLSFYYTCVNAGRTSSYCDSEVFEELVDKCTPELQCVKGKKECQPRWSLNNLLR
jgi:hypothetical protein